MEGDIRPYGLKTLLLAAAVALAASWQPSGASAGLQSQPLAVVRPARYNEHPRLISRGRQSFFTAASSFAGGDVKDPHFQLSKALDVAD